MDKCPACGADTRPGDNYCLNCGQRLLPSSSSMQAQPGSHEPTVAASDWSAPGSPPISGWSSEPIAPTVSASEAATYRDVMPSPVAQATLDRVEQAGCLILRSESGDTLQEYLLDKPEIVIGRAPTSDILLSKDKLTSRRHAVVRFERDQYYLQDEHSANGTLVNGQQIEEGVPLLLHDGDQVAIGEHELVYRAYGSAASAVEDLPTVAVPQELTYRTRDDALATIAEEQDEFVTMPESEESLLSAANSTPPVQDEPVIEPESNGYIAPTPLAEPVASVPEVKEPVLEEASSALAFTPETPYPSSEDEKTTLASSAEPVASPVPATPVSVPASSSPAPVNTVENDGKVSFKNLTTLPQPSLPDMGGLMAALSTLDGQVMALQEQFNSLQDSMRSHDGELASVSKQLRTGIRRVAERMDNTIADVARSRETLAWAELLQLMEDTMNNPRDIEYVTRLARKARELNKVFQIHQNVLNTMAECNSLLRSMIGEDR